MNQDIESLLIDWGGLKHLRITAAKAPKMRAKEAVMSRQRNWNPPCFPGLSFKDGVLPFLPAVNIESKIPPRVAKIIPSIGYPLTRIVGKQWWIKKERIGAKIPMIIEATGSIMTEAEELKKIPD